MREMTGGGLTVRVQPSLLAEAQRLAKVEGIALDQLINAALAEKLAAIRAGGFFEERAKRGDVARALEVLEKAGNGREPVKGDEL